MYFSLIFYVFVVLLGIVPPARDDVSLEREERRRGPLHHRVGEDSVAFSPPVCVPTRRCVQVCVYPSRHQPSFVPSVSKHIRPVSFLDDIVSLSFAAASNHFYYHSTFITTPPSLDQRTSSKPLMQLRHMAWVPAFVAGWLSVFAVSMASANFDLAQAVEGVYYSKISYCQAPHIASWTCGACPKFPGMVNVTVERDEDHDAQGYVGYNPQQNQIVVAFRGTVNLQGWIVDGDFFQTPYVSAGSNCSGCLVHEGLFWAYQRLSSTLLPATQALATAYPNASILVTGHSMGAGLAGFAFPDVVRTVDAVDALLKLSSPRLKRLYNYGSPRLGNPAFVAWLENTVAPRHEHFRCTNFGDPIVHLAPIVFDDFGLGDWLHAPREVFFENPFGNPANFRLCRGSVTTEDPTCADSTPIWDMLSFVNHTTYLNIGLGCFL